MGSASKFDAYYVDWMVHRTRAHPSRPLSLSWHQRTEYSAQLPASDRATVE